MSSPWIACTTAPSRSTSAAATSSCVSSGLAAQSATSAPPAISVRVRFAVSVVTCRQTPMRRPANGRSRAKRSRIERSTGIPASAHAIRASPASAWPRSATSDAGALVAIVVRLVRAVDRDADVGGLLGAELRESHAERVEVQPRDLLVEVLRQHVDLALVLVVLREQLDLGDRLVRERVAQIG